MSTLVNDDTPWWQEEDTDEEEEEVPPPKSPTPTEPAHALMGLFPVPGEVCAGMG